ncbi:MAG TPA: HAMP domain-containing sensor histidine kinase, partial [Gillisia sp.]|nr:HAMP domain-containing sensor histidine kinase [Gillisia sp.]
SVRDYGIGIDKVDYKKIFKRFYRVSGKNEETYSGFGIGLFLAKDIIERHNGTVLVKSKKGKGSEFIFTLNAITD